MKRLRLISALLLCLALVSLPACGQSDDESGVNQQPGETIRTDTQVTISGRGTIVASNDRNLSFNVDGKIHEIYVNEGDKVSRGDALVKLDTTALELAFTEAEADLVQVQAALLQARATQEQAEYNLEKTREPYSEDKIDSAERAVALAEDDLEYAKWMLDQAEEKEEDAEDYLEYAEDYLDDMERLPYDPEDPDAAQEKIDEAEAQVRRAQSELDQAEASIRQWEKEVSHAESDLTDAKQRLEDLLDGPDESALEAADAQLEAADKAFEAAEIEVKVAEQAVTEAQKQLGEATLTAPFGGEVAKVYVDEGDRVLTGTTTIRLIDPTRLQLIARIYEIDVVKVKTGQKVNISIDAMPETVLEGLVTFISPVDRDPGAVLFESDDEEKEYEVKIDFEIPENSPIRVGMNATAEIIIE